MASETVCVRIEHQAVMFALLAKHAVLLRGQEGKDSILRGMTIYGKERGSRMAGHARRRGDEINIMTNQAYGEWKPDFPGQMEFGQIRIQPTLQTYISRCAWCDAWKKHGLTEYGKLYCVNVDNAVYQGYQDQYVCTQITEPMSWGGTRCEFDWGCPLTPEENEALAAKKQELGSSCMEDMTFHTAHILSAISRILLEDLGEDGRTAVDRALADFTDLFGAACLEAVEAVSVEKLYPKEVFPQGPLTE